MDLVDKFKAYIKTQHLFQPTDRLLLAVSGGLDSVVLCALCKRAGYSFAIAHCNFQLRGAESDRDEQFVKTLGETYGVEIFSKKFDTRKYATENKLSIQVAARELRYSWFYELLNQINSTDRTNTHTNRHTAGRLLVTAHHANDAVETLLMNFFKGTGISGLHGILPRQEKLVRPLLFAKKEEIRAFASEQNLAFVEDSSNTLDKYTRNYFRNQLIPGLQTVYPGVEDNLLHNLERFHEIEILYNQSVALHKKKLLEQKGSEIHIPVQKLLNTIPLKTVMYEIIKDFGFTAHQTTDAVSLLKSDSGKFVQSASHRIIKNRNWLIISPNEAKRAATILIDEKDSQVVFELGKLQLEQFPGQNHKITVQPNYAQLDSAAITYPLLLRRWKPGDYFYPLGMKKKKKLSRFFIDQKLSISQKEKTWVIEMDKKIIWVVGHRIDDRFKLSGKTKHVLQISLTVSE